MRQSLRVRRRSRTMRLALEIAGGYLAMEPLVLFVEDDTDDEFIARHVLHQAGVPCREHIVGTAEDAIGFLERAIANDDLPTLVLLDITLPGMTGLDFLEWVRAQPNLKSLPVVVLSGSSVDDERKRAEALGADGYLLKFPTPYALASILRAACAKVERNRSGHQGSRPLGGMSGVAGGGGVDAGGAD